MKPLYALDKLFTHKLFLNKYFLYAVSAISAFVNLNHVMYHEFEYVALFIFIVLVAKGFSKNWAIVLMIGLGLSQMFNLSVKTYEGFASSGNTLQNKIDGLKQRIANKKDSIENKKDNRKQHKQRIDVIVAEIQTNKDTIEKYRTERAQLEQSELNIKDPVAKAHAINSTDQQKKKTELTNKIKALKEKNELLRSEKDYKETKITNINTTILPELNKELKKLENELARAKARKNAKLNKLLKNKNVKQVGPGPAKATAKFSLMQEDDSDQSDDEEMEPKLQTKRPDDFDFLDPAKIGGLTQGTTKLMTTQKDLFTFMNSITPFIENAKKMLKDVDVNKLTASSK